MMNKKEIEEYLKNITNTGYLYFIYSNKIKMIYVGESSSIKRINIYKSIIEEKDDKKKIQLYNYYTNNNTINYELAGDIVNPVNEFKIIALQTKYHKHLEKTYIRYLHTNRYSLYNKHLYNKHKCDFDNEIDLDIINKLK